MKMFYFLTPEKLAAVRLSFQQLKITGPETGDRFFENFGPGNTIYLVDRPYERFSDYEQLLKILKDDDPQKYLEIHKGTPFYFLAWTAFDLRNYEKATFYMDAAISEDIRKSPQDWLGQPASNFLTLNSLSDQVAKRITEKLRGELKEEIDRFVNFSKSTLAIDNLVEKFAKVLVTDTPKRSIITAFYSFILEFDDRYTELRLRSVGGGSIEPFLSHLFKGGLIVESLLKHLYPTKDDGKPTRTLGDVFHTSNFQYDFLPSVQTNSTSLVDILGGIQTDNLPTAFNTTSKLRNTTGHNLVWDDIFNNPENYKKLYEQIINTIFFVLDKKYL